LLTIAVYTVAKAVADTLTRYARFLFGRRSPRWPIGVASAVYL